MRLAIPALALALAGCAAKSAPVVSVTAVVRGDAAESVRQGLAASPSPAVEVRAAELPSAPEPPPALADADARLATARAQYLAADFGACLSTLSGDALVRDLLFARRRTATTRLLLWRIACSHGAGLASDAETAARLFASLGLEVPGEVAVISPQAERVLANAIAASAAQPRVTLSVSADVAPATLSVDGRDAACLLPCSVDVAPGDHVLRVDADGAMPAVKEVRVTGPAAVAISTTPAPPAVAARQWLTRYASQGDLDSAPSLRLLSTAMRAQRLALLQADRDGNEVRLRGVLASAGEVVARGERRTRDAAGETAPLLRDLLVRGKVLEKTPLVRRPEFWVVLALGILVAGAGTAAVLYEPPVRTRVRFEQTQPEEE